MRKDILVATACEYCLIVVTKNEYVYESFSEDDVSDVPKGKKNTTVNAVDAAAAATGDKKKGKAECGWTEEFDVFLWEEVMHYIGEVYTCMNLSKHKLRKKIGLTAVELLR